MVEHRAPRVNDQYLPELLGIHLVGMTNDKNIMFKLRQGHGPFVFPVLSDIALLVEQSYAAMLLGWWIGMDYGRPRSI